MEKFLPALAFIAIIFLAGCSSQPKPQAQNSQPAANPAATAANNTANAAPQEKSGSISDLLKGGMAQKCVFNLGDGDQSGQGTVYVDGKSLVRVDTVMTKGNITSHLIKNGDISYVWSDSQPDKGVKFVLTQAEEQAMQKKSAGGTGGNQNADVNKNYSYQCEPWVAAADQFQPPANVQFQDLTSQFKDLINQSAEINNSLCQTCSRVPAGQARTACEQANCH